MPLTQSSSSDKNTSNALCDLVRAVNTDQPLSLTAPSNDISRVKDTPKRSALHEQKIELNLAATRHLLNRIKTHEKENGDHESLQTILFLQPRLRDHFRLASEAWVELSKCSEDANDKFNLERLRCEIEKLRLSYSRCRMRHASLLISMYGIDADNNIVPQEKHKKSTSSGSGSGWRLKISRVLQRHRWGRPAH